MSIGSFENFELHDAKRAVLRLYTLHNLRYAVLNVHLKKRDPIVSLGASVVVDDRIILMRSNVHLFIRFGCIVFFDVTS